MGVLNNVTTTAGYQDAATLAVSPPSRQATVVVTNAAVYVQFRLTEPGRVAHPEAYDWEAQERFLVPGAWQFIQDDFNGRGVVGVRARSALGTAPAQVSIHA